MTQQEIINAISNAVAEFREYIDAHNGDIDTPRDELIMNIKKFFDELARRYGGTTPDITEGGIGIIIDSTFIEFQPLAEFIRVGEGDFISTRVGKDSGDSAKINRYVAECMYTALRDVLIG